MPASSLLIHQVGHALRHLYDPDVLRAHPLISALGLDDRTNPQAALRDFLIGAIEGLRPEPSVPANSRAWRVYKILNCRYVQQLEQDETADQLGVGVRQLRREQSIAIAALADSLGTRDLPASASSDSGRADSGQQITDELSWLRASQGKTTALVQEALLAAASLTAPLAANWNAHLGVLPASPIPPVVIHPAALQQVIVSLTTYAIRRSPGGSISLSAERRSAEVLLHVVARAQPSLAPGAAASLDAAQSILSMYGGQLEVGEEPGMLSLIVALPVTELVNVLLVDDNVDVAQLFTRYTEGTRYHLHSVSNAESLFAVLSSEVPRVILLDVMIPGVDGWEILGRLRQHPLTSAIPIIVCTVLPERDLALALGATAFLAKPVTRSALLSALDQTLSGKPPEPH